MKSKSIAALALIIIVFCAMFVAVLHFQTTQASASGAKTLFQVAAFNTFSNGSYAGYMKYADLAKHGDFGIGTFDGLNGEMVAVNGVFYQITTSGVPQKADPNWTTPYATVTYFKADMTFTVSNLNYTQLKARIDQALPSKDAIYAIKVSGTYDYAQTRAPAKQTEPYPPLTQALKTQAVFKLNNVSATAVGFWFPSNMDGVDYTGYHLHFITDDHSAGGHLLDCIIDNATVEIDQINTYDLVLP